MKKPIKIPILTILLVAVFISACIPLTVPSPQTVPPIPSSTPIPNISPSLTIPVPVQLSPGNYDDSILVGSTTRTYRMVVPRLYSGKPLPMVIFLHGRGGDGRGFEIYCGMTRKAESAGFIVVYPDALGSPAAWNAGFNRGRIESVDDVTFIKQLIKVVPQKIAVDPQRIYVGGYSSGGIMSYRLATELADTVAAFGIMAGTIGAVLPDGRINQIPKPKQPASILHIHGKKDDVVPYDGTESKLVPSEYLSAPKSIQFWVKENGCNPTPQIEPSFTGKIIKEKYTGCSGGVDVTLYTLPEGDHGWPAWANEQDKSTLTASDLMWEYFASHKLSKTTP